MIFWTMTVGWIVPIYLSFQIKITEKNGKLKGCLISEDRERVMQFLRETEVFDNATKDVMALLNNGVKS